MPTEEEITPLEAAIAQLSRRAARRAVKAAMTVTCVLEDEWAQPTAVTALGMAYLTLGLAGAVDQAKTLEMIKVQFALMAGVIEAQRHDA